MTGLPTITFATDEDLVSRATASAARFEELLRQVQRKIEADLERQGERLVLGYPVRTSEVVPPGQVWIVGQSDGELKRDEAGGYTYVSVVRVAYHNPRDVLGHPIDVVDRHLLYTRHTLGGREAARDYRRHRRPIVCKWWRR